jgi:hypothetical protein
MKYAFRCKRRTISSTQTKMLFEKQNGQCIYCVTYLPDAIKQLQNWIGDREWNGELITENHYQQLIQWRDMVKAGHLYQPTF